MNSVAELMMARKSSNSKPGARVDGAKIGLVIEGGGMRGVVSAGMVAALEELGLTDCFDAVYGSSAGAINGAYFIAKQAKFGTTIYYQDISNSKFINFWRPLTGAPVLSLEFLLDHVMELNKPLAWDRVLNSEAKLVTVASSLDKGHSVYLADYADKNDLRECLRASARIPIVAGKPLQHRGMRLWDALIFEAIPIHAAAEDGCSHVLCLLTRPQQVARSDLSWFETNFIAQMIGRECAAAKAAYLARVKNYNRMVRDLSDGLFEEGRRKIECLSIQIDASQSVVRGTETRPERLVSGAKAGFEAVYSAFGLTRPRVVETLSAY